MVNIGIDNGVTGTFGIIDNEGRAFYYHIPTKQTLNYQKTKVKHITRIDVKKLRATIHSHLEEGFPAQALIERPFTLIRNGKIAYDAMMSGGRALEAVLITLESLQIGYDFVDSKAWQNAVLPHISVKDKKEYPARLKQVSLQIGMRLYPNLEWNSFKDADGLLIAHFLRDMTT